MVAVVVIGGYDAFHCREQQKQVPEVCCAATQTDAVQPPSCEQPPDEALDQQPPSEASKEETDTEETCDEDASDLRKVTCATDLLSVCEQ